jgi:hypothetical protein
MELFQEEKLLEKKRKDDLHSMKPIEIRDGYMDGQFSQIQKKKNDDENYQKELKILKEK